MLTRRLGRSGIEVSAIGLGTNAYGGSYFHFGYRGELPVGYGPADDAESERTVRRALELGVDFFDTAAEYGCGRAERILGRALGVQRQQVVIATKFGYTFDEEQCRVIGVDASPAAIRHACEDSLRRLNTDCIDLYLLHLRDLDLAWAAQARDTLEELVEAGKIRWYGWSTDDPERARFFAYGPHCTAIEHRMNVFVEAPEMLSVCEQHDLASVNRIPLLMGLLAGRYQTGQKPPVEDMRRDFFTASKFERDIVRLERIRPYLMAGGRTLAQGALCWLLARSPLSIPIPGARCPEQVEQNAAALDFGPLEDAQMQAIAQALANGDAA